MPEAAHAQPAWVLLAYLIAGVCFILALRGLSSPESSRRGNYTGMVGMAIAVGTTLAIHRIGSIAEIAGAMVIGGGIGLVTARKIQMTAMPQLVAAFHSLVGMAAVLVGAAAFLNPSAFGIVDAAGRILLVSRVEMVREDYARRLAQHREGLAAIARATGWSFAMHRTDRPPQTALLALYGALAEPRRKR